MAAKKTNPTISVRFPEGLVEFMENDIRENRDHRNRTEYIVTALREYEVRRAELKRTDGSSSFEVNEEGATKI